jgi:hypothetical protein
LPAFRNLERFSSEAVLGLIRGWIPVLREEGSREEKQRANQ